MDERITDEARARAAALSEAGAKTTHELITSVEKDLGAADTVDVLHGVIDACACYLAAAVGPEAAVEILNDVGTSLGERLAQATKAGHLKNLWPASSSKTGSNLATSKARHRHLPARRQTHRRGSLTNSLI